MLSFTIPEIGTSSNEPTGKALVITWKTKSGNWKYISPHGGQCWSSYETEDKALEMAYNEKKQSGDPKYLGNCGKFRVYQLSYDYESYNDDVLKIARDEGYNCDWP